jgi:hypothetical protein
MNLMSRMILDFVVGADAELVQPEAPEPRLRSMATLLDGPVAASAGPPWKPIAQDKGLVKAV